jgi:DNA-binding XRE family transcriptional regulator
MYIFTFHAKHLVCTEFRTNHRTLFATVKQMKRPRNIVGPVVRELRERKGLTQAQFVAKLNLLGWDLSRETFAKIESQIRWVADFEISKLAKGLRIDAPELLRRATKR